MPILFWTESPLFLFKKRLSGRGRGFLYSFISLPPQVEREGGGRGKLRGY